MNIVIGARGQDGSYLIDRLCALSKPVIGIGREGICKIESVPDHALEAIERMRESPYSWEEDARAFSEFLLKVDAKVVFDCAASHSSTREFSRNNQAQMYLANVRRTTSLQEALILAHEGGRMVRLITCGSSLMFNGRGGIVANENTQMMPQSGYGFAKVIARKQCEALRYLGIEASMAILFNHDSARRSKEYFLPRAIKRVQELSQGKEVGSFGNLKQRIDIGCAEDVVDALLAISRLKELSSDYIVATGRLVCLESIVDYIGERCGVENASELLGEKVEKDIDGESYIVGDIRKIQRDTGWSPSRSIFRTIDALIKRSYEETDRL